MDLSQPEWLIEDLKKALEHIEDEEIRDFLIAEIETLRTHPWPL